MKSPTRTGNSPFHRGRWRNWRAARPRTSRTRAPGRRGMKSRRGSSSVMVEHLIILPEAEQDSDNAYAWYEEQRSGLGQRFLAAVETCLTAIQKSPKAFTPVLEHYRRAV